jgi:hypothetical protein
MNKRTKCTANEKEFCRLIVVKGMTQYRAYCAIFQDELNAYCEKRPDIKRDVRASSAASRILKKWYVMEYVAKLEKSLEEMGTRKAFLSLEEKRKFLADVVRTPVGQVDEESPLAQEIRYGPDGSTTIKMPGKLNAIELDARLQGEFRDSMRLEVSEKVLDFTKAFK